jgi:hypothetical protein
MDDQCIRPGRPASSSFDDAVYLACATLGGQFALFNWDLRLVVGPSVPDFVVSIYFAIAASCDLVCYMTLFREKRVRSWVQSGDLVYRVRF